MVGNLKVLFYNLDRGAGVEFIGNILLDVISRFNISDKIYLYKSQDFRSLDIPIQRFRPDIVILNDITEEITLSKIFEQLEYSPIVINFLHGTIPQNLSYGSIFVQLNPAVRINSNKVIYTNFVHGNIWEDYKQKRSKKFLFFGRIVRAKLPEFLLDFLDEHNIEIDIYGPIVWKDYISKYNKVNYKGILSIDQLSKVLNKYQYLIMASTSESLSLSLREAVLSGVIPIVYKTKDYMFGNVYTPYVFDDKKSFLSMILDLYNSPLDNQLQQHITSYNHSILNFNHFISFLQFLFRGLLLKKIQFNPRQKAPIIDITPEIINASERKHIQYMGKTIDWSKIEFDRR